jgi:hypothetical protein
MIYVSYAKESQQRPTTASSEEDEDDDSSYEDSASLHKIPEDVLRPLLGDPASPWPLPPPSQPRLGGHWAANGRHDAPLAVQPIAPLWQRPAGDHSGWHQAHHWPMYGGRYGGANRYHLTAGGMAPGFSATRRECLPHVLEGQDRYICDELERIVCLGKVYI